MIFTVSASLSTTFPTNATWFPTFSFNHAPLTLLNFPTSILSLKIDLFFLNLKLPLSDCVKRALSMCVRNFCEIWRIWNSRVAKNSSYTWFFFSTHVVCVCINSKKFPSLCVDDKVPPLKKKKNSFVVVYLPPSKYKKIQQNTHKTIRWCVHDVLGTVVVSRAYAAIIRIHPTKKGKKRGILSRICVSSMCWDHANLLCIFPNLIEGQHVAMRPDGKREEVSI